MAGITPRDDNLRDYREDQARQERKDRLERHLSEMWPLRKVALYRSEEQLYSDLRACLESYWDPPDTRYFDVLASTILLSYRVKQFETIPYPFLYGPKNSGKSRALDLLRLLCYNPIKSSSISSASIYQVIDKWHPTLLIDETDKWGMTSKNGPGEAVLAVLQVLNSGYRRGDYAVRASRDGSDPIVYDLFGLKVIAGTERLPDTLEDRTIRMEMARNERDIPLELDNPVFEELRNQLEGYYTAYNAMIGKNWPSPPKDMDTDPEILKAEIGDNRVTELVYPLYCVCPSDQGKRNLLELAKETVAERRADEQSGDLADVLQAVMICLKTKPDPVIPLELVLQALNEGVQDKEKKSAKWLGWKLKKLQLKTDRVGHERVRVVIAEPKRLARACRRYAPLLPQTTVTTAANDRTPSNNDRAFSTTAANSPLNATVATVATVSSGRSPLSRTGQPEAVRSLDPEDTGEPSNLELALVRKAMRKLQERQGYAPIETLRYLVREQSSGSIDAKRLTRIMSVLAKNGELSADGADCFKLKT